MKVKGGIWESADDCFARFDEAFAKLEADLAGPDGRPATPSADLSEYEEALDNIDRQLAGQPQSGAAKAPDLADEEPSASSAPSAPDAPCASGGPGAPGAPSAPSAPRPSLALVPPIVGTITEAPRAAVQDIEPLWEPPAEAGTPLARLVVSMQNLLWLQRAIHSRNVRVTDRVRMEQVTAAFEEARRLCHEFDLPTARVRADFAIKALDDDRLDVLGVELGELVRHIRHDLQACSIVPIPREHTWGFSLALEGAAQRAFPSVAGDVADAGRCIGFGMHAAAAFHLLRAAECGRRAIARAVRFNERDAEAADWIGTIAALQARMLDLAGWPAGPARKAVKHFLTALLSDAKEMDEARRRLSEGEKFEECHAMALWYATRDFLTLAAERVSEADDTLLTPDDFIPRP